MQAKKIAYAIVSLVVIVGCFFILPLAVMNLNIFSFVYGVVMPVVLIYYSASYLWDLRPKIKHPEVRTKFIYIPGFHKKKHRKPDVVISLEPEIKVETKGEFFKRLGIDYKKAPKITALEQQFQEQITQDENIQYETLRAFWKPLIDELKLKGKKKIARQDHYGSLRGRDIVRSAATDLRRLGYPVDVRLDDYAGTIYLRSDKYK